MKTVRMVFVCSGNICRSPMAAGYARQKTADRGIAAAVLSCGTLGLVGQPAAQLGQLAMQEVGIDISDHYSQGVQPALIEMADYVVVMAPRHEAHLRQVAPRVVSRIVRMWEWADEPLEQIDDPVGKDLAAFRACREVLDRCLDRWLDTLVRVDE